MPRRLLLAGGILTLILAVPILVQRFLDDPTIMPPDDYVEYWAAARLTLTGGNPYDAGQLLPLEHAAGRTDTEFAILMLNPPWTIPLILPLGMMPARLGQLVWLLLHFGICFVAGDRLWRYYGGKPEQAWVGWALAITFAPTFLALRGGQISPYILLGVVGFLEFYRRDRPFLAGAAVALAGIKPHLVTFFWFALLFEAARRNGYKERRVILGGLTSGIVLSGISLALNPMVFAQYFEFLTNPRSPEVHPPLSWSHTPTLGFWLRHAIDPELFRLQSVPTIIACLIFPFYYRTQRARWDWSEQMPTLITASLFAATYTYAYDWSILLPAVLQGAVWIEQRKDPRLTYWSITAFAVLGVCALQLPLLVEAIAQKPGVQYLIWIIPVIWWGHRSLRPRERSPNSPAEPPSMSGEVLVPSNNEGSP